MVNFLDKNAPSIVSSEEISAAQTIVDAGKKVKKAFGIKVDTTTLEQALVSTEATPKLIAALSERELPILDTKAVREYRQGRLRGNMCERFQRGVKKFLNGFDSIIDRNIGRTILFVFASISVGIPFWIDMLWYDIAYLPSFGVAILIQFVCAIVIESIAEGSGSKADSIDKIYILLNCILMFLIFSPLILAVGLTLPWFFSGTGKRSWKSLSAKEFLGKTVSDAFAKPIALMAIASEIVPAKTIQFDVLHDEDGKPTSEAFLTVDVPGLEQEKLYLWHGC